MADSAALLVDDVLLPELMCQRTLQILAICGVGEVEIKGAKKRTASD